MMSGRVGDLSKEQEGKLKEFQIAIRDLMRPEYDDYFLLRWLRARKFDVDAAEIMLRQCLNWRESVGADKILDFKFPDIVYKYAPGSIIGHDKEGNPLWLIVYKDLDLNGWLATEKLRILLLKYIIFCIEETMQDMKIQSRKLGKQVELMVGIHDLDGLSVRQMPWRASLKFIEECLKIYDAYYPERLKSLYVINLPKFCEFLFPLTRMILSAETQKKLKFFSKGADWRSEVLKEIDPSELPEYWGGTRVDPDGDPKCPSIVRFGGKIPTTYYKMSISEYLLTYPERKTSVIAKSTIWDVSVVVEKIGSVIEWNFMTENHDIGFGVSFKGNNKSKINEERGDYPSSNEDEVSLIPIQRVQSNLVPENGIYKCDMNGTYLLKFDNSYSWYYAKKLHYSISVVLPTPEII